MNLDLSGGLRELAGSNPGDDVTARIPAVVRAVRRRRAARAVTQGVVGAAAVAVVVLGALQAPGWFAGPPAPAGPDSGTSSEVEIPWQLCGLGWAEAGVESEAPEGFGFESEETDGTQVLDLRPGAVLDLPLTMTSTSRATATVSGVRSVAIDPTRGVVEGVAALPRGVQDGSDVPPIETLGTVDLDASGVLYACGEGGPGEDEHGEAADRREVLGPGLYVHAFTVDLDVEAAADEQGPGAAARTERLGGTSWLSIDHEPYDSEAPPHRCAMEPYSVGQEDFPLTAEIPTEPVLPEGPPAGRDGAGGLFAEVTLTNATEDRFVGFTGTWVELLLVRDGFVVATAPGGDADALTLDLAPGDSMMLPASHPLVNTCGAVDENGAWTESLDPGEYGVLASLDLHPESGADPIRTTVGIGTVTIAEP